MLLLHFYPPTASFLYFLQWLSLKIYLWGTTVRKTSWALIQDHRKKSRGTEHGFFPVLLFTHQYKPHAIAVWGTVPRSTMGDLCWLLSVRALCSLPLINPPSFSYSKPYPIIGFLSFLDEIEIRLYFECFIRHTWFSSIFLLYANITSLWNFLYFFPPFWSIPVIFPYNLSLGVGPAFYWLHNPLLSFL